MADQVKWPAYTATEIVDMLQLGLSSKLRQEAREELKQRAPVPWCPQPEQCAVTHRCPKVPVCSE